MPDKLPKGWVATTLGELLVPSRARTLPSEQPGLPYVGMEHVESQTMKLLGHGEASGLTSSSMRFNKGDVLYGKLRPYLNKVWLAEFDGLCSAEFLVFPKTQGLNNQFLAYRLNSHDFVTFANHQVSGERPRVDFDKLASFPVLLPPSREQDRIVAKLDPLVSHVAKGEAAASRALDRLEQYRAAVLQASVTGELTKEWRKTHPQDENGQELLERILFERRTHTEGAELKRYRATGNQSKDYKSKKLYCEPIPPKLQSVIAIPESWTLASLDQLLFNITDGDHQAPPKALTGVPLLVIGNLRNRKLDFSKTRFVPRSYADEVPMLKKPHRNDILYSLVGSFGIAVLVKTDKEFCIQRHIALLRPHRLSPIKYLSQVLNSHVVYQQADQFATGTAQRTVALTSLRQFIIPLPPKPEQEEIFREVERRLAAADRLTSTLTSQLARAKITRQSLLREAFAGKLAPQEPDDEHASVLKERLLTARINDSISRVSARKPGSTFASKLQKTGNMSKISPTIEDLQKAWQKIGKKPNAKKLFDMAGFTQDQVAIFYELLRATSEILNAFKAVSTGKKKVQTVASANINLTKEKPGRFRLISLWLDDFKNLKDYEVRFDASHGLDIILGWNGTGKSNLFEAFVIIFRDLHYWWEKNKWPEEPMAGYRLRYEIENHVVEVKWNPSMMKRPEVTSASILNQKDIGLEFQPVKRENIPLPRFVFGYYSGPTNRLAEHFWPMKRDHYERLRDTSSDDPKTLAKLLEQRRFFCAEASHAKYVLLAFSYKEDPKIWKFLEDRLRIVGFESALFVIRKPRWGKGDPEDFWGAKGIMRRVMEKLRDYAVAPMVLKQKVADGYRLPNEELYYFFIPDLQSLQAFAAEYINARSFFLALESTDFSELIYDLKIQVRVKAIKNSDSLVTFRELSEGEQQLLMVLGLMRFTKSHQSLVLLDEPDTHLNPHWSVHYLKDLESVISEDNDDIPEQQTSQLLMATHDPLVIASLVKDQVHLLKRDRDSLRCYWQQPSQNPRGLGYTGILLSDMFGFRSDLDEETLGLLDRQVQLAAKPEGLTPLEIDELASLNKQIEVLGFKTSSSDPYYRAFIEALSRSKETLALIQKPVQTTEERAAIRETADQILARLVQKHAEHL
jgi:restriction endonuclease S subunit/predicted ATPase